MSAEGLINRAGEEKGEVGQILNAEIEISVIALDK